MLAAGARRVRDARLGSRIRLVLGRAESLPFPDASFDALTFTYLLRYVDDPAGTLGELARVLRPGGVMASLEFGIPMRPVWRAGWRAQTRLALPVLGWVASPEWRQAGSFLGPSIERHRRTLTPSAESDLWRRAGVRDVRVRELTFGSGVVIWGRRAS
jgi:demethylmenaquinone methyltransferase/2-methoxy-6-polyprenyl-1,4-benzoquinol methylase